MLKVVVLFGLIACAVAKPGLFHGAIAAPVSVAVAPAVITPTAVSQQTRHDIINPGALTISTVQAAPVVAAAPAVRLASAATSRLDVRQPVLATGVVGTGLGLGLGLGGAGLGGVGLGGVGLGGVGLGTSAGLIGGLGGHGIGK